jgi:hypothetical protein
MSTIYGELDSEKLAKDSKVAREINKEIGQFGINDRQRWLLIYYLSLELENVEEMQALTSYIKEVKGSEIFISKIYGEEKED